MAQPASKRLVTEATAPGIIAADPTVAGKVAKGALFVSMSDYASSGTGLNSAIAACAAGGVLDLANKTINVSGAPITFGKRLRVQNGDLVSTNDRVATVTAAKCRFDKVSFTRTGDPSANEGAVTVVAAGVKFIDCDMTSSYGSTLRIGNGTGNGLTVLRGDYICADSTNGENCAIEQISGANHSYDHRIDGVNVRHTGYGTGIGLYNVSRCRVSNSDVRGIRANPWVTITGFTQSSGTIWSAPDRTDVVSNVVWVDGVEIIKDEANANSTTPGAGLYTNVSGIIYLNVGDPTNKVVRTRRTNGYGILFYATTSETVGMHDNSTFGNVVEDTDGFGIYFQTLQSVPRNNSSTNDTVRGVCKLGIPVGALPFAGIGFFGGYDLKITNPTVDGVGTSTYPAPGISIKASLDGSGITTGVISGATVRAATANGVEVSPGTWRITSSDTSNNTGHGLTHRNVASADTLNLMISSHVSRSNTGNGINILPQGGSTVRVDINGAQLTSNVRNLAASNTRDLRITNVYSELGSNNGMNIDATNLKVLLDNIRLGGGVGIVLGATMPDLTIGKIVTDATAGTKFAYTGPYKQAGVGTFGGEHWVCTGTPEGQVTAKIGSVALRTDGAAGTVFYVKESGTGNTGWVAK